MFCQAVFAFPDQKPADYPDRFDIIPGALIILVILFLPDGMTGAQQKKMCYKIISSKRFFFMVK